ncbi:hypothetical protein Tco_1005260 [Tanacetum coccineum]|uniref:Reverse transcriptase domain-containing protein n=1 Tax=Tanacetum coccineum TaxID=301880 RepID=A0ABQ5FEN4_9ASTR
MEYDFDANASIPVTTAGLEISIANIAVSIVNATITTASASISTVSPPRVSTTEDISGAKTLVYIRRSASKANDKGKAIMQESEPQKKIKKRVQVQISIDEELAKNVFEEVVWCMRTRSQSRNSNLTVNKQQLPIRLFVEPFNLVEPIENQAPLVVTMDDTRTMAQLLEASTVGYEDSYACPHHGFSELHQLDTFYNALNSNDQDSLNSAAGGNFLDKMPRDCLRIIESKSKVPNSLNKPVVSKVSSSSSTPGISPDVAELKDMVKALHLDKKSQAPAPVKAVEECCVTCSAAATSFNQGNTGYRAPIANQIRPSGFPPIQQNQGNNQNRYNQNRGNNYNQSQIYRPPINQPPVHQAPPYQASAPQTQGVTNNDFESYVKANDAVMRNMQDQNQNLQNQMTNLTDKLSKFVNSNTASTSGSGTLPSNTITNPKVDLKGITTRSGVAYQGPTIPTTSSSPSKVVECEPDVTKDTVLPTNNESTKDVQPSVVQVQP